MRKYRYRIRSGNDKFLTGMILVLIGGALLIKRMGVSLPEWLFSWPMIIVLIGIVSGVKQQFHGFSWLIITAIGVFFLSDRIVEDLALQPYFWPVMIIGFGLLFMLRPGKGWINPMNAWRKPGDTGNPTVPETTPDDGSTTEYIESTSVFAGDKKVVTSKHFGGGEITCFMGGSEINLGQADITGPVYLEVTMVFGGTKLIVPPHWEIRSESIAVFAGIEDKRVLQPGSSFDPNKILIIRGTSVFGGIEIKSY